MAAPDDRDQQITDLGELMATDQEDAWATCATDQGGCGGNLLGPPARPDCPGPHTHPWTDQ